MYLHIFLRTLASNSHSACKDIKLNTKVMGSALLLNEVQLLLPENYFIPHTITTTFISDNNWLELVLIYVSHFWSEYLLQNLHWNYSPQLKYPYAKMSKVHYFLVWLLFMLPNNQPWHKSVFDNIPQIIKWDWRK